jgi:hypothetical protein
MAVKKSKHIRSIKALYFKGGQTCIQFERELYWHHRYAGAHTIWYWRDAVKADKIAKLIKDQPICSGWHLTATSDGWEARRAFDIIEKL